METSKGGVPFTGRLYESLTSFIEFILTNDTDDKESSIETSTQLMAKGIEMTLPIVFVVFTEVKETVRLVETYKKRRNLSR